MIEVEYSFQIPGFKVRSTGHTWVDVPPEEAEAMARSWLCNLRHWDEAELKLHDVQFTVKTPLHDRIYALEQSLAEMITLVDEYIAGLKLHAYPGWEPHSLDDEQIERAKALLKGQDDDR